MKRYSPINKSLAMLLAVSVLLALLAGCSKKEMTKAGEVSDFESQAHIPVGTSGDASDEPSGGASYVPVTGELIVSEKKYTYKEQNLMLLHVKNDTDTHYDLTIRGKYLDADGNTLKEESQTYRAFPAGWENYFIFRPKIAFDGFDYTVEVNEFKVETELDQVYVHDGEPLSTYAEIQCEKELYWFHWWSNDYNELLLNIELINHHPSVALSSEFHVLALDEQGEIYGMDYEFDEWIGIVNGTSGTAADPIGGEDDGLAQVGIKCQPVGENGSLPENVKGITTIFAFLNTIDSDLADQLYQEGKLPVGWIA